MHQVKIDNQVMNLSLIFRMFSVATVLSFSAVAVRAQLKVGGREVGRFAGDTGSEIASGGSVSASEVMAGNVQFDFTYNPLFGAAGSIPLTMSAPGAPVFGGALVANTARTFTSADSEPRVEFDDKIPFENEASLERSLVGVGGFVQFNYALAPISRAGSALVEGLLRANGYGDVWTRVEGGFLDSEVTAPAPWLRLDLSQLISALAPSTFGLISALALAGLLGVRHIRHHSAALAK